MANVITDLRSGTRSFVVLPSEARTASPDTMEFEGLGRASGLVVVVDVTAADLTADIIVKLQGVDRVASGKTWDILTSASLTAAGTTVLRVRPGITGTANVAASEPLPSVVRISVTHAGSGSITYSVSGHLAF
ncbi:hypothetical protein GCM10012275_28410 [Longimycelium tulufanense]|uniref:Uncharacterized protein n=1 Tax=Longimycelium tulufanense TaxID=907463 RepID=A0A8J3CEI3_9PSEU|nr:hypothetical protein [Longimycelium tulufanense]GGM55614.1 hypothetical protein GCM10012275_28410 [Longimycelium tulufanense]